MSHSYMNKICFFLQDTRLLNVTQKHKYFGSDYPLAPFFFLDQCGECYCFSPVFASYFVHDLVNLFAFIFCGITFHLVKKRRLAQTGVFMKPGKAYSDQPHRMGLAPILLKQVAAGPVYLSRGAGCRYGHPFR